VESKEPKTGRKHSETAGGASFEEKPEEAPFLTDININRSEGNEETPWAPLLALRTNSAGGDSDFSFHGKVDGIPIEVWYQPRDKDSEPRLLELLGGAKKSIHFMQFAFYHPKVTELLIAKHNTGVEVAGAVDTLTEGVPATNLSLDSSQAGSRCKGVLPDRR